MKLSELLTEGKKEQLLNIYGGPLSRRFKQLFNKDYTHQEAIQYVYDLDHTNNKTYVEWLMKMIIKLSNKDDISLLVEFMKKFDRFKSNKEIFRSPDINAYTTLDEVKRILDIDIKSRAEQKTETEQEFYSQGDAKLIYNGQTVKVIEPLTYEASCFFGKKTKWCTTSSKGEESKQEAKQLVDYFSTAMDMYYVIIKGTNKKYGMIPKIKHYVDEEDKEISITEIFDNYPEALNAFDMKELAHVDGEFVRYVDDYDYLIPKITDKPHYIAFVKNPSDVIIEVALESNPMVSYLIPNPSRNILQQFSEYFTPEFLLKSKKEMLTSIDKLFVVIRSGFELDNDDIYYTFNNINIRDNIENYILFSMINNILKRDVVIKQETLDLMLSKAPIALYLFYMYDRPVNPHLAANVLINYPQILKDMYNKKLVDKIEDEVIQLTLKGAKEQGKLYTVKQWFTKVGLIK